LRQAFPFQLHLGLSFFIMNNPQPFESGTRGSLMAITCPACGGISNAVEQCEHCRAELSSGQTASDDANREESNGIGVTHIEMEGAIWRAHQFTSADWEFWQPIVEERLQFDLAVLPPIRVIEVDAGIQVQAQVGRHAHPWESRDPENPLDDTRRLLSFIEMLAASLEELHRHDLVWLNFDPAEIEEVPVAGATVLRLTNMDLQVFKTRRVPDHLVYQPAFAAPEVAHFDADGCRPATDVFHLALFSYYWLAGLLPVGFPGMGPEAFHYAFPPLRVFAPELIPGVARVLERGLARRPAQRYPAPRDFIAAFRQAVHAAEQRWTRRDPVRWEIGRHTRTGRAKEALGRANEDSYVVRLFNEPNRALLAVADGISTCDIGNGAIASLVTCIMVENAFDDNSGEETFREQITDVCRRCSENLLSWALEKGYRDQLLVGKDLMGTTLLAAWLQGNTMTLANVGDSRAYLLRGDLVEQLTVDGDLGNELLANGMPPEDVMSLGHVANGLRDCVGGCMVGPDGVLRILQEHWQPMVSRWPLLPGDVIVLCSDGLVEEGTLLEREAIGDIVRRHAHLSCDALASVLADAADNLNQLPSAQEPFGIGDNITCIVIRITE
jgi:PPM family protein phosphatase